MSEENNNWIGAGAGSQIPNGVSASTEREGGKIVCEGCNMLYGYTTECICHLPSEEYWKEHRLTEHGRNIEGRLWHSIRCEAYSICQNNYQREILPNVLERMAAGKIIADFVTSRSDRILKKEHVIRRLVGNKWLKLSNRRDILEKSIVETKKDYDKTLAEYEDMNAHFAKMPCRSRQQEEDCDWFHSKIGQKGDELECIRECVSDMADEMREIRAEMLELEDRYPVHKYIQKERTNSFKEELMIIIWNMDRAIRIGWMPALKDDEEDDSVYDHKIWDMMIGCY